MNDGRGQDVLKTLDEALGRKLVAHVMNASSENVDFWLASGVPARQAEALEALYEIYSLLRSVDSDPLVRAWLVGMNPDLGLEAPANRLAAGDSASVIAAAKSFQRLG